MYSTCAVWQRDIGLDKQFHELAVILMEVIMNRYATCNWGDDYAVNLA